MSYNLTPVIVDIQKLKSLMGSKDTVLLQAVIKKHRKDMLDTDAIGEDFDDFEDEIKAEYKKFVAGDFSGVDLNATYPEREDDEDDDDEEFNAMAGELKGLNTKDPAAMQQFLGKHSDLLKGLLGDEDDEDDDEDEEDDDGEPGRELTAGAALAHLILGGNQDKSHGYKYGYALRNLCEYLGEVPEHDSWCTIRSASFEAVDKVLKKIGVKPAGFTTDDFLVNRGAPVAVPKPDDFPYIGYLTRAECRQILESLDPAKVDAAIRAEKDKGVQEWLHSAIGELRSWLEACVKADRDLVCFYS